MLAAAFGMYGTLTVLMRLGHVKAMFTILCLCNVIAALISVVHIGWTIHRASTVRY